MAEVTLSVAGMKCGGCVANVQKALAEVAGVESVAVSLEDKTAVIQGTVEPASLARAVTDAGYPAEVAG